MKTRRVALLPGDGIGPEVVAEAVKVLRAVEASAAAFRLEFEEFHVGAGRYIEDGDPLPGDVFERISGFDAVLLGAMGLPSVRRPNGVEIAPQLDLRERWELFAGLRPIKLRHADLTPLRDRAAGSIDFLLVRENTEGLFHSRRGSIESDDEAVVDGLKISRAASDRLFRAAFEQARKRRGKVTLVDKSNVLPSMVFLRRRFDEAAERHPDIEAERIYIDAAALYFIQRPESFDVVVTENMFGDILSDLGAGLIGGMGLAPSGDVGETRAVFQPSHGSAPDIAGRGVANPSATILSAAMMLEWLGHPEAARRVENAVDRVLANPADRTSDLGGRLDCAAFGDRVAAEI